MIPIEQIERRLAALEDALTERKLEGVKPDELRRTIVGFANSVREGQVGLLFVGVEDRTGRIVGVESPGAFVQRVQDTCTNVAYPAIEHQTHIIQRDDKTIVAVAIPPSSARPHFSGPAWIRDGARTIKAPPAVYEQLIASRNSVAGALQQIGREIVSIVSLNKPIGHPSHMENRYKEEHEGRIEAVDAQKVTFYLLGSGRLATEPLAHVTISRDDAKHRPRVIVRAPN